MPVSTTPVQISQKYHWINSSHRDSSQGTPPARGSSHRTSLEDSCFWRTSMGEVQFGRNPGRKRSWLGGVPVEEILWEDSSYPIFPCPRLFLAFRVKVKCSISCLYADITLASTTPVQIKFSRINITTRQIQSCFITQ